MQAQLSKLQKMFCQLGKSVNANKNRVEPYICVYFSDSKQYIQVNNKICSYRRNILNKLLTPNTRAQNDISKIFQTKLFQSTRLNFFLEALNYTNPSNSELKQILVKEFW